jgi:uncharacterized protein (UPF0147 family)
MFEDIIQLIKQVAQDRTVPRNIRSKCEEAIAALQSEKDAVPIRINTAISILDEISSDVNLPMYARTQIWNIASLLEAKQKSIS